MVGPGNYFKEGVGPKFGTHWSKHKPSCSSEFQRSIDDDCLICISIKSQTEHINHIP